jgi:hypothetical protein
LSVKFNMNTVKRYEIKIRILSILNSDSESNMSQNLWKMQITI